MKTFFSSNNNEVDDWNFKQKPVHLFHTNLHFYIKVNANSKEVSDCHFISQWKFKYVSHGVNLKFEFLLHILTLWKQRKAFLLFCFGWPELCLPIYYNRNYILLLFFHVFLKQTKIILAQDANSRNFFLCTDFCRAFTFYKHLLPLWVCSWNIFLIYEWTDVVF